MGLSDQQAELITHTVNDDMFPLLAADYAMRAEPLLTARTAMPQLLDGSALPQQSEADRSYQIYPAYYGRLGILKAMEAAGVVHIPSSCRNIVNENISDDGKRSHLGGRILQLISRYRKST